MNYRDRDRLSLSVLLAAAVYTALFFFLNIFAELNFNPFPKVSPPIYVELDTPLVPPPTLAAPKTERERPEVKSPKEEPPKEPVTALRKTDAEGALNPAAASGPASGKPPAQPSPGGGKGPQAGPKGGGGNGPGPMAKVNRPGVDMTGDPENYDPGRPVSPRLTTNTGPGMAEALRAEIDYLEKQKERWERWSQENPTLGPQSKPGTGSEIAKRDPVAEGNARKQKEIDEINKKKAALEKQLNALAQAGPGKGPGGPGASPGTGPGAGGSGVPGAGPGGPGAGPGYSPDIKLPGGGGMNIKGDYYGRTLVAPLKLALTAADFDGLPPRKMEVKASFLIGETGIPDPLSLKISGETRYTKVTEKIRSALLGCRFSSSPGATSKGEVSFEILMNDAR